MCINKPRNVNKTLRSYLDSERKERDRWQEIKSRRREEERKTNRERESERESLMDGGMDAQTNESMYLLLTKPPSAKRVRETE